MNVSQEQRFIRSLLASSSYFAIAAAANATAIATAVSLITTILGSAAGLSLRQPHADSSFDAIFRREWARLPNLRLCLRLKVHLNHLRQFLFA